MLDEIKRFCRAKQISWNRFGTLAVSDGNLVLQMEGGRNLGDHTANRVRAFMAEHADTEFAFNTLRPADGAPRQVYNPNLTPYLGSDDWQLRIATGSAELYRAIARAHPERITA